MPFDPRCEKQINICTLTSILSPLHFPIHVSNIVKFSGRCSENLCSEIVIFSTRWILSSRQLFDSSFFNLLLDDWGLLFQYFCRRAYRSYLPEFLKLKILCLSAWMTALSVKFSSHTWHFWILCAITLYLPELTSSHDLFDMRPFFS